MEKISLHRKIVMEKDVVFGSRPFFCTLQSGTAGLLSAFGLFKFPTIAGKRYLPVCGLAAVIFLRLRNDVAPTRTELRQSVSASRFSERRGLLRAFFQESGEQYIKRFFFGRRRNGIDRMEQIPDALPRE